MCIRDSHNPLRPQNRAVRGCLRQIFQYGFQLLPVVEMGRLGSPAREHFIRMMVMMPVMVMMMVVIVMLAMIVPAFVFVMVLLMVMPVIMSLMVVPAFVTVMVFLMIMPALVFVMVLLMIMPVIMSLMVCLLYTSELDECSDPYAVKIPHGFRPL